MPLTAATLEDLGRSGLSQRTIASSGIRDEGTDDTIAALLEEKYHVQGFVIPYFGLDRKEQKFFRIKVLKSLNGTGAAPPKYLQPKATGNHLYVAPTIHDLHPDWQKDATIPVFITEGEKKALAGIQAGLPVIGVGGVFNWRTHFHTFDGDAVRVINKASSRVVILDDKGEKAYRTEVAPELADILWEDREVILLFDSDTDENEEVQRAAFELANELAERGALPRQISLANRVSPAALKLAGLTKVGLDDLLRVDSAYGGRLLDPNWREAEGFRPLPSDPRQWVGEQLKDKVPRTTQERVARFAVDWLDANGTRFMGSDGTYYYFDNETRILHDFRPGTQLSALRETSFGHLMVEQLGIDPVDSATLGRFLGHYPLGAPIINPHRVLATSGDAIYYQISDADVVRVDADGFELLSNGDDDMLFFQGGADPIDGEALSAEVEAWHKPKVPMWYESLSTLDIDPMGDLTKEDTLKLLTCLFYVSPWLSRWRGLMLPLEIAVAEPNSGKSFTYNLRKGIITGRPSLAGLPDDFKGWVAGLGAAPAMWVCDNLGNVRTDFWHRLNDELARLITDPNPAIELRKLYTTATTYRVPINCTFAITTIRNPFTAPDVLQRALVYHLNAIPINKRDPDWYTSRLGNRLEWVAEHLNYIHMFFQLVKKEWKAHFKSGFRLVHFEQAILLMGKALGWDMSKIITALPGVVAATVAQYDPVMEAIVTFFDEWDSRRRVTLDDICTWVEMDVGERFTALRQFSNEITLARYVGGHKYDIEQTTGVKVLKEGNGYIFLLPGGKA